MRQRGLPAPRRGGIEQVLGGRAFGPHDRDVDRRARQPLEQRLHLAAQLVDALGRQLPRIGTDVAPCVQRR